MIAVVTRVTSASVAVDDEISASIGGGYVVLLGVEEGDSDADAAYMAHKICGLRVFSDEAGKMNLSLADVGGSMLVVSNFTLAGDCKKGFRPSFDRAAPPDEANRLYELFVSLCREVVSDVQTGVFRAHMNVASQNDGPVTLIVRSR